MALDPNINKILFLRSATPGAKPALSLLGDGELAFNLADRTIYTKNGNNLIELGFGTGGVVSGDITAPNFIGAFKGNADTATKFQTARKINNVNFDGTQDITILDSTKLPLTGGTLTGLLTVNDGATNVGIRIGSPSSTTTPFLDFSTGTGAERSARIIASGGATGANDNATLRYNAATHIFAGEVQGTFKGNADTATKLQTGRSINGTNFDGSGNIVTDYWGASRTFSFGNTTKSVNGSGNMTWTLAEMGAFPLVGGTITGNVKINGLLTIDVSNDIGTFKKLIEGLTQTDGGYLAVGNSGADKGYVELGTTDDAEIYATQRGTTNNIIRRATLLDGNGNTTFPGTVNAALFNGSFTGDMSGNASSATKLQTARLINGETFDGTQDVSIKNIRSLGRKPATDEKTTYPLNTMSYSEVYQNGFPFAYGNAIFIQGGSGTNQLALEWGNAATGNQRAFLRSVTDISNTWGPWREFAFTNGTIDIAKKLETPRKINGVNFDGTQDITVADSTKLPLTGGNINGNLGVSGRLTSTDVVKGVHFHATGVNDWMPTDQGSWITWNSRAPGQGQFEFVNHQGSGAGGFTWYNGNSSGQTAIMRLYSDGSLHITRDVRVDASLNLANNTWNTIGDDVRIGDKNVANKLAIQGTWGPGGVAFFHNDSQVGSIDNVSYTGNAATSTLSAASTKLQTARKINGVNFDGTQDITIDAAKTQSGNTFAGNNVFNNDVEIKGDLKGGNVMKSDISQRLVCKWVGAYIGGRSSITMTRVGSTNTATFSMTYQSGTRFLKPNKTIFHVQVGNNQPFIVTLLSITSAYNATALTGTVDISNIIGFTNGSHNVWAVTYDAYNCTYGGFEGQTAELRALQVLNYHSTIADEYPSISINCSSDTWQTNLDGVRVPLASNSTVGIAVPRTSQSLNFSTADNGNDSAVASWYTTIQVYSN
ncbi:tail fiber protein [Acinetobacter phage Acj9]|uniref:Gp37 large distal tail fiber subunit n=1 Tax=Acinetobacter phage Acj9 TaxID=760939 RepID=E5EQ28_9CAUD|nr:tail fiber protein [Acinetobacter phage Acj9]ADG60144.1 gp37 large distal tail fiber subunit [Acinetobacter phage Acj9]